MNFPTPIRNIDAATLCAITAAAFATLPRAFVPATAVPVADYKATAGRRTFRDFLALYNNIMGITHAGRYAYFTAPDNVAKDLARRGHDVRKVSGDAFEGVYVVDKHRPRGIQIVE